MARVKIVQLVAPMSSPLPAVDIGPLLRAWIDAGADIDWADDLFNGRARRIYFAHTTGRAYPDVSAQVASGVKEG